MERSLDFEKIWHSRFSKAVTKYADKQASEELMKGAEELSSRSSRREVISWSKQAMNGLLEAVGEMRARDVMTSCACQYPASELRDAQLVFKRTHDIDKAIEVLQGKFEGFLKKDLHLDQQTIDQIIAKGWGLAGVRKENTIIATKIPKSGNLARYMAEPDRQKRRALYCHCPRISYFLEASIQIPPIYCYCGAGFYKGIWETILQETVQVEVLESLTSGSDECKIAIYLPSSHH